MTNTQKKPRTGNTCRTRRRRNHSCIAPSVPYKTRQRGGGWLSARGTRKEVVIHEGRHGMSKDKYTDDRMDHEKIPVAHTNKKVYIHIQLPEDTTEATIKTKWRKKDRVKWFTENDRMHTIVKELGTAMQHFYREYRGSKLSVKNDWKNSPLYIPLGPYKYNMHREWYRIDHLTWRVDNEELGWKRFATPKMIRKCLFFPALRLTWMLVGAGVFTEGVGVITEAYDMLEMLLSPFENQLMLQTPEGEIMALNTYIRQVKAANPNWTDKEVDAHLKWLTGESNLPELDAQKRLEDGTYKFTGTYTDGTRPTVIDEGVSYFDKNNNAIHKEPKLVVDPSNKYKLSNNLARNKNTPTGFDIFHIRDHKTIVKSHDNLIRTPKFKTSEDYEALIRTTTTYFSEHLDAKWDTASTQIGAMHDDVLKKVVASGAVMGATAAGAAESAAAAKNSGKSIFKTVFGPSAGRDPIHQKTYGEIVERRKVEQDESTTLLRELFEAYENLTNKSIINLYKPCIRGEKDNKLDKVAKFVHNLGKNDSIGKSAGALIQNVSECMAKVSNAKQHVVKGDDNDQNFIKAVDKCIECGNKRRNRLNDIKSRIDPTKFLSHVKPWLNTSWFSKHSQKHDRMTKPGWHCRIKLKEDRGILDNDDENTNMDIEAIELYYRYKKSKALGWSAVKGLIARKDDTDSWYWTLIEDAVADEKKKEDIAVDTLKRLKTSKRGHLRYGAAMLLKSHKATAADSGT